MKKPAQAICIGLLLSKVLTSPGVAQTADTETITPLSGGKAADLKVLPRIGAGFTTNGAGYQEPYFSLEGFAPLQQNPGSDIIFLEGKLLFFTDSNIGANLILGKRFYNSSQNGILGGYVSYDVRDTSNHLFHQIGAGFERLGDAWDLRINGYLPVGNTREKVSESLSNPFFQQNYLLLNRTTQFEAAMAGVDVESGGRLIRLGDGDLRGYAGVYYYSAQGSDSGFGVRGRLEARPTDTLRLGLSVQHDPTFDTKVVVSLGVNVPGTRPRGVEKSSVLARLGESVERKAAITVDEQAQNDTIVATNPKTGTPFIFRHVTLGTGAGNGTFENPSGTVQDGLNLAQSGDIVYVQAGTNPGIAAFTIPDGVSVLSTAVAQSIDTVGFSVLRLPLSGSGVFPVVNGTVTLGNNTTLSGFAIANATGSAIQGTSIQNVTIRDNRITNPSEQGINLTNVAGTSLIANNTITGSRLGGIFVSASGNTQQDLNVNSNTISDSGRQGIFVQASENAQQKFTANSNTVSNSVGQGIFLQTNKNSQQTVAIANSTISRTSVDSQGEGGQGLFAQANSGAQQTVKLDNTQVSDSANQGIFVSAFSQASEPQSRQNVTLNGTSVTNSSGQGIFLQGNNNSQQTLAIANGTINGTTRDSKGEGGQGLFAQVSGGAQQTVQLESTKVSNSAGQGIFVSGFSQASEPQSRQNITLNGTSVSNSTGQGVFLQANNNSQQQFAIANSTINGTSRDSKGEGGQGLFAQANSGAQQQVTVDNSQVSNSAGQGVFFSTSSQASEPQSRQNITLNGTSVSNSAGQGVFLQANNNSQQTVAIANGTIKGTAVDSKGEGGQGLFAQTNGGAQQQLTVNSTQVSDSAGQGMFFSTSSTASEPTSQQTVNLNGNTVTNSKGQGVFFQGNGNSTQQFAIANSTINGTTVDSKGNGGQGIFTQANGGAQQNFNIDGTQVSNSAGQGIFVSASSQLTEPTTRQSFVINNTTVNNSAGQGIFVQASNNSAQQVAITNSTINGTTVDSQGQGGQGIFTQANGIAQQNININKNTVSNSAGQGIFMQANSDSQVNADVQFNILQNNTIPGFYAVMNATRTFCVRLNGNNSNTNFVLQRNNGTFQVSDRDSVSTNNTGTVDFAPAIGSFTAVTACP
ncbi:beta strand repeat-containing protein [Allocoleopsis sp.]|uniref:beta strand repeat-containing protein n=1 Tax=Allocoleopsis sp. TaxID=3088169 RepID=UPI002FD769E6